MATLRRVEKGSTGSGRHGHGPNSVIRSLSSSAAATPSCRDIACYVWFAAFISGRHRDLRRSKLRLYETTFLAVFVVVGVLASTLAAQHQPGPTKSSNNQASSTSAVSF